MTLRSGPIVQLTMVILVLHCGPSHAETDQFTGAVPVDLYSVMVEHKCSPIPGFYRNGANAPPFVFTRDFESGRDIVIVTCWSDSSDESDKQQYKIIVMREVFSARGIEYLDYDNCPSEILLDDFFGGLGIASIVMQSGNAYNLWEDSRSSKWTERIDDPLGVAGKTIPVIEVIKNGMGIGLFCADGHWYNITFH